MRGEILLRKTFTQRLMQEAINANKTYPKRIVFSETEEIILRACSQIAQKGIATPIILGKSDYVLSLLKKYKIKNLGQANILDFLYDSKLLDSYAEEFVSIRKNDGKQIKTDEARSLMMQPHYYAGMMLHKGLVDGMISGINSATKPYYPAFHIIKTRQGIAKASGLMIMEHKKSGKVYFFADIALNIDPDPEMLAQIAIASADTVKSFGIMPRVAMLSFSTHGSAKHDLVEKVTRATSIVRSKRPDILIDGELQLDAAIVPEVAIKKCPDSPIAGNANVLIFPDLNSGNIGYKLVQRLGGFEAAGPIMQGLNKPVNDLSRGASVDDVAMLAAMTVLQCLK